MASLTNDEKKEILFKQLDDLELKHIDSIITLFKEQEGNEVTLLQDVQNTFKYIPRHVIFYLSKKLNIPIAKLFGVATFYAQFTFNPRGKYVVSICDGTACHVKGSPLLIEVIENELGIKSDETTEDGLFTCEVVRCLGCCAIAPVCFINDKVHGNLTPAKFKLAINRIKREEAKNAKK